MSIALVVTAGFGNGTLTGTIKDVVLRGYSIGVPPVGVDGPGFGVTGTITNNGLGRIGGISNIGIGRVGTIQLGFGVVGKITNNGLGLAGEITNDGIGKKGDI